MTDEKITRMVRLFRGTPPRDEGTIIVFGGEVLGGARDGLLVSIAVDHRMAEPITAALAGSDDSDRVLVEVEDWQIVG